MKSISVFLDKTNVAKNANVSRTEVVCHAIYIFLDNL